PETDQIRFLSTGFTDSVFPECVDIRCDITGKITEISDFHSKLLPILGNLASLPDGVTTEVVSLASAWSAIYRRSVFVSSGIRFESERQFISEDYVFNIEFAAVSRSIIFTPERFYYIRYNPGSLTRSLRRDRIEKSSFLCSHIERRLVTLGFDPSLAAYLSMGLMLVYMRAHTDHIISAPIPVAEKKQLFREMAADPLVSRIASDYRFPKGSGRHRLLFALRNSYLPTAFLVHLTLLVKRVLKKG
ncbi:MAG: hypothetical protein K2K55_07940, partial [Duncaniella sp.]|nr:hypothetical protein [Duncaniella sp.]